MKKRNFLIMGLCTLLLTSCFELHLSLFIPGGNVIGDNSSSSTTEGETTKVIKFGQNVQDLNYTDGAMPSTGTPRALVIPVDFSDCTASSKGYSIDRIEEAFNGEGSKDEWESVNSFFKKSSYGKLDIQFDVVDTWFRAKYTSSYYNSYVDPNDSYVDPAEIIIKEYLDANDENTDFSVYDSNGDEVIDAIYIIYSHSVDYSSSSNSIWWAYQYYYMNYDYYDKVTPYYYVFAGYEFMFEDNKQYNAHTYIHETGHLMGLEDYYDYDNSQGANKGGLAGADMMDFTVGDHNPFSKILLGWVDEATLIQDSCTIDLNAFQDNGDFVILASSWDSSKGMFQEYFIVEYWTPTGLNEYDQGSTYLYSEAGIRVLHISASISKDSYGYLYFDYDNSYTKYKLITLVTANGASIMSSTFANNNFLYRTNKYSTFSGAKYNSGTSLDISFTVNSLSETSANITFTKN